MKILHTSDWHLGAQLGPFSRINEQKLFIDRLCGIVDEKGVDMVIVAGDVFDSPNPSAAAEALFFQAMAGLAMRKIPVILVAGNHDSVERLAAPSPMTSELGVLVFATPNCQPAAKDYGDFAVKSLGAGCAEILLKKHSERVVLATMPFVSEKRLGETIFASADEVGMQKDYSAKVGELFAAMSVFFRQDTINIAAGHFHVAGGEASRGLERDIALGGSFAVHPSAMPDAQYIAMGHLHRSQKIKCGPIGENLAYYAGSPLPYSLSEQGYPKAVFVADLAVGQVAEVEKVILDCPKPIEVLEAATVAEAMEMCGRGTNSYKYIRINEAGLNLHDIKEMRRLAPDIVEIDVVGEAGAEMPDFGDLGDIEPRDEFANFYAKQRGFEAKSEVLTVFDEILHQENEENE